MHKRINTLDGDEGEAQKAVEHVDVGQACKCGPDC